MGLWWGPLCEGGGSAPRETGAALRSASVISHCQKVHATFTSSHALKQSCYEKVQTCAEVRTTAQQSQDMQLPRSVFPRCCHAGLIWLLFYPLFLCCSISKQVPDIMAFHLSALQYVVQKKKKSALLRRWRVGEALWAGAASSSPMWVPRSQGGRWGCQPALGSQESGDLALIGVGGRLHSLENQFCSDPSLIFGDPGLGGPDLEALVMFHGSSFDVCISILEACGRRHSLRGLAGGHWTWAVLGRSEGVLLVGGAPVGAVCVRHT